MTDSIRVCVCLCVCVLLCGYILAMIKTWNSVEQMYSRLMPRGSLLWMLLTCILIRALPAS